MTMEFAKRIAAASGPSPEASKWTSSTTTLISTSPWVCRRTWAKGCCVTGRASTASPQSATVPFGAPTHPTCTHLGAHAEHHARTLWRKLWPEESGRNGRNLNQFVYLGCIHEDSLSWLKRVNQAPSSEPHRHGPLFVAFSTGVRMVAQILKMFGKSPMFLHSTAKRLVAVSNKTSRTQLNFLGKVRKSQLFFRCGRVDT